MSVFARARIPVLAAAAACTAVACSDSIGPGGTAAQFTQDITFEQFEDAIAAGDPVRVEAKVTSVSGGPPYVLRELEIEELEDLADREEVKSRVTELQSTAACEGTLVLELENAVVAYNDATRFERDDDGDMTCQEFLDYINGELGAGRRPEIEAKREPRFDAGVPTPQAPDNPVFDASRIEVEDESSDAELEMSIDDDNLLDCSTLASPPAGCVAVLKILDVMMVIDDMTDLEAEIDDDANEAEFEGFAASVDMDANDPSIGTVTLTDGRVIRITEFTEIESADVGDDDNLGSLAEVDAALQAGLMVEAEAEGVLDESDPNILIAHEAEFEIEDDDDDDDDDDDNSGSGA